MGELNNRYVVVLRSDQGPVNIETVASSSTAAASMVCLAEGAPLSAVEEVRFVEHRDHIFEFTVYVTCATLTEARQVMAERIMHDEDYGFPYTIDYE